MVALDGFLLTRQWRDTPQGIELVFWAATEHGPLRLQLSGQEAVCFIDRQRSSARGAGIRRQAVNLKQFSGQPVDALYFRQQKALTKLNRDTHWHQNLLESDVKPTDRFLMERFVRASFTAAGEVVEDVGYLSMQQPRIKPADVIPTLTVASIDIETQGLTGALYSIAAICGQQAQVFMVGDAAKRQMDHYTLSFFPDEARLLQAFFTWLQDRDPDVLIGWNVIDFDLDYLARTCRRLQIPLALGRGSEPATVLEAASFYQPAVARLPGRAVLDGIALLKAGFWSFERFTLEHVARELLGKGKLIGDQPDKTDTIDQLFLHDKPTLAEYNWLDCQRVVEIFAQANLLDFAVQRATMTGLAIDRLGGAVAAFDNLYLPRLHRRGYVAPNVAADSNYGLSSPGGYVMDSQPGLYDNVLVLDFKSLYPSIIRTFLIDPLGLALADDDPVPGFQGGEFSRQQPILPDLITELWAHRDVAKAQQNAPLSQAIKIIMNSFYGVLGTSRCRFHDHRLASSITERGHQIITESRDWIETQGYQVIYGDTDSVFVLIGPDHSEADVQTIGAKLANGLNAWWSERLRKEYRLSSTLEVEFETHFLRFLMPTIRGTDAGSKKRYAGIVRSKDQIDVVFKGLEAVRTDWTPLAREFQRELYRRIFFNEPYQDFIRNTAQSLQAGECDSLLVYRKTLRRPLADYQRNVPPHVQAARKQSNPGKIIEYMITRNGPEPIDNTQSPLDYQHYLERQLAPAADGILYFLETSFAELTDAQLSLL